MIEQLDDLCSETGSLQSVDEFWYHSLIIHLDSNFLVETKIKEHPQSNLQQKSVVARNKSVQFLDDSQILHLVFVFSENGQLFQKVEYDEKKIRIIPFKHGHQKSNNLSVFHFALDLKIFSKIEQQVERDKKHLLLFLNDHSELLLVFCKIFGSLFVGLASSHLLQFQGFLFKFADSNYVPFYLMVDDFDSCITNLISKQELMELSKVAVSLEDIE